VLMLAVNVESGGQYDYDQGDTAVAGNLLLMLFKKAECVFDFQRKLVRLEFFAGDPCHGNL